MSQTLSIYIPKKQESDDLLGRLEKLAKQEDRSVNYLVVRAIREMLDRKKV